VLGVGPSLLMIGVSPDRNTTTAFVIGLLPQSSMTTR
jgi:hypothetical protein